MAGWRAHIVKIRLVHSSYLTEGNIVGLIATEGS